MRWLTLLIPRRASPSRTPPTPPARACPSLGQWHTLRVVALGDQIQGWLDGASLLDHRDARLSSGRVGLWTKADSVTAFDDVVIRGVRP
jgi:hypothetical protein